MTLDHIIWALLASERWWRNEIILEISPADDTTTEGERYKISTRDETDWCARGEAHKDSQMIFFPSGDPYEGKQYCCACLLENFNASR